MNFTPKNFNKALKKIGIKKNDNLFIHSDLGLLKEYKNKNEINKTFGVILKEFLKIVIKMAI